MAGLCAQAASLSLSGDGTAESPYLVTSATDWNALAAYISESADSLTGKYVQLTADIDFTDTAISSIGYDLTTPFNGDLDGNGKSIKGFSYTTGKKYDAPVMAYAGPNSYIHDITVEGEMTTAYQYTAGIFGKLYGKLYNLTGKVNVTSTATMTGGIAAYIYDTASLTNVVNEGNVTSSATGVAGIAYYSASGVEKYENCGNRGTITYTGTTSSVSAYVAGLVASCSLTTWTGCWNEGTVIGSNNGGTVCGLVCYTGGTGTFYMTDCYNAGDVTGYCANGIMLGGSNGTCMVMTGCYNTGAITGTGSLTKSGMYTGGLAAGTLGSGSSYRNCWNSGTVTANGTPYTGGLFGYYKSTSSYYTASLITTITGCYNTGNVTSGGKQVGGIMGYQYRYVEIDSCWNTGNITGDSNVGGISGQMYGPGSIIQNSWNAGSVSATGSQVGGIVGYSISASTVENCFNVGNVTADGSMAGGLAGYASTTITNSYNTGNVTGGSYTGGVLACSYLATSSTAHAALTNVYTTGKVVPSDTICGNILGNGTDETKYWDFSSNSLNGTYYLTVNEVDCVDSVSVGLSYAELATLQLPDSAWTCGDNYTYPRITTLADNDYAKAHAAAVIPADGDSYTSITKGFYVGTPDGVTWTASSSSVEIDGNNVTFSESFSGTLTMTATSGDVSVATELTCDVVVSGITGITGTAREVVSERFYTVGGAQVAEPADGQKAIYIVVKTYSDGTTTIAKEAH